MNKTELLELYSNARRCADVIGLRYVCDENKGIGRIRRGKGWSYMDIDGGYVTNRSLKEKLAGLAIPPAWQSVWICPGLDGHILATGIDEKGRKQYIYHSDWRALRDMLNFYKLISFGEFLPGIRRTVNKQIHKDESLDRQQVLSLMLWFLDNGYIRIGNETYYEENETVGLATLAREHIMIDGSRITLAFTGKSGQEHNLTMENARVATLLKKLAKRPGDRLFVDCDGRPYSAEGCNEFLHGTADDTVSAKNFRTWGGTLAAFEHLKKNRDTDQKPEKVVVQAVDKAAEALGNTRAVARSNYVHPHILQTYIGDSFADYYARLNVRRRAGMTRTEVELLEFLKFLFKKEFKALQKNKKTASSL